MVMLPSPSLSNRLNASLNSAICSSVIPSTDYKEIEIVLIHISVQVLKMYDFYNLIDTKIFHNEGCYLPWSLYPVLTVSRILNEQNNFSGGFNRYI